LTGPGLLARLAAVRGITVLIGAESDTTAQACPSAPCRGAGEPRLAEPVWRNTVMTEPVTLYDGYYTVDTRAWLDQRVGAHHDDRSTQLQDFTRSEVFDRHPTIDLAGRMQLWCAAHQFSTGDGALVDHDDSCLTKTVTIVLAASSGRPPEALALVSIDGAVPEVYADLTTDEGSWLDADTITITCPDTHRWTWDGGSFLYAADGREHRAADLFRSGPVISRCRDCAACDNGTAAMCWCRGFAVYCPRCDQRCQVGLPAIATFKEIR
jgi:hypothetical protein